MSASAYCVCVVVLCVSLCQCSFVCGRHSIYYVCVTCCDLDVTKRLSETAREEARGNVNGPFACAIKKKRRNKIRKLAVARVLFLNSNLLLPPTVYNFFLTITKAITFTKGSKSRLKQLSLESCKHVNRI